MTRGRAVPVGGNIKTVERYANAGRIRPPQVWGMNPPARFAAGEGIGAATSLAWIRAGYIRLPESKGESGSQVEANGQL